MSIINADTKIITDYVKAIIPVYLDNAPEDIQYKEKYTDDGKIVSKLTSDQIEGFSRYNINADKLLDVASYGEICSKLFIHYLMTINEFGRQNIKDKDIIFTESLSYNIDYAFDILDKCHTQNERNNPFIVISYNDIETKKKLWYSTDFIANTEYLSNNEHKHIDIFGTYKDIPIYHVNIISWTDVIVGYNYGYTLHYSEDSLTVENMPVNNSIEKNIKFKHTFINDDATKNYVTIKNN